MTLDDLIFLRRELPRMEQSSIDNVSTRAAIGYEAFPQLAVAELRRRFAQFDEVFELAEAEMRRRETAKTW